MKNINIIGGGLGGLSAAHYLRSRFPDKEIAVYEASLRTGGWIKSKKLKNGVLFQQSARTIRPHGPAGLNTLELIKDLNLFDKIVPITRSHPAAKNRMIYAKGSLVTLPNSLSDIMKTTAPFTKPLIFHLMQDLVAKKEIRKDESIYAFISRRFGTEVADYLISPLICGICAGDAKDISVKFLIESLFEKEQKYGSITRGLMYDLIRKPFTKKKTTHYIEDIVSKGNWSVYTFAEGLDILPKTLETELKKKSVDINLASNCTNIQFGKDYASVQFENQADIDSDHLISSISSKNLSNLIKNQHPKLAELLRNIPMVTVAVVNLQYDKKLPIKDAFGFLVPPSEKIPILGTIFDSCCSPDPNNTVLTVMMGGKWYEKYFGTNVTEEQLLETANKYTREILQITEPPAHYKVNILKDCIPQYIVGHKENLSNIEEYIKNHNLPLTICGFSYYGVGVNDVILGSKNAVKKL